MSRTSYRFGRIVPGVADCIITAEQPTDLPPLIYQHSNAADPGEAGGVALPHVEWLLSYLVDATGRTVVATTQPLSSFANNTAQNAILDALDYAHNVLGCADGPAGGVGTSMGSANLLRYAALNPGSFDAIVTELTLCDLDYAYLNIPTLRAAIETAYGIVFPAPLPANVNPADANMMLALQVVRLLLLHADNDDLSAGIPPHIHPWPIEVFVTGTGARRVVTGAQGHADGSIAATNRAQVAQFLSL